MLVVIIEISFLKVSTWIHLSLKSKRRENLTSKPKDKGMMRDYQHVQSFRRIIDLDASLELRAGLFSETCGENTEPWTSMSARSLCFERFSNVLDPARHREVLVNT